MLAAAVEIGLTKEQVDAVTKLYKERTSVPKNAQGHCYISKNQQFLGLLKNSGSGIYHSSNKSRLHLKTLNQSPYTDRMFRVILRVKNSRPGQRLGTTNWKAVAVHLDLAKFPESLRDWKKIAKRWSNFKDGNKQEYDEIYKQYKKDTKKNPKHPGYSM